MLFSRKFLENRLTARESHCRGGEAKSHYAETGDASLQEATSTTGKKNRRRLNDHSTTPTSRYDRPRQHFAICIYPLLALEESAKESIKGRNESKRLETEPRDDCSQERGADARETWIIPGDVLSRNRGDPVSHDS